MARYYKLIDAANSAETFNLAYLGKDGGAVYRFYTLYPGVKYSEHADDPLFLKKLKEDAHKKIPYTDERKKALDACGARYEVATCKTCGGRKRFLDVWLVEVAE